MRSRTTIERRLASALLLFGLAALLASLAVIVADVGAGAFAVAPVHESAPRSLAGVVVYPEHALRELPHLVLLAMVWLAAASPARDRADLLGQLGRLAAFTAAIAVILFAVAAAASGIASAWADLGQSRAACDLVASGAHFRFHLLSDLALGGLYYAAGRAVAARRRGSAAAAGVAGALFAAAVLAWGLDQVTSPRFVGHAGREVETGLVVVLPVLAALALRRRDASLELRAAAASRSLQVALGIAALALAILARLAASVDLMAAASAPSRPVALNLAVHHFEHLFDVTFLAAAAWREERHRDRESGGRRSTLDPP